MRMDDFHRGARSGLVLALVLALGACATVGRPTASNDVLPPACDATWPTRAAAFAVTAYASGLPTRGQWRDGFDLGDMDADGRIDLLHGPARKGRLRPAIFRGDGRGAFSYWRDTHFPPLPYDYGDAKAADFNGDGVVDIALAVHLHGVVTLIHEGGGSYAPWGEGLGLRAPADSVGERVFSSRSLLPVDWNRDGRIDLIALNEGPTLFAAERVAPQAVQVYLNRGGLWEPQSVEPASDSFGDALALGDIDGDGQPEALMGTQRGGEKRLLLGPRGDGGLSAAPVEALAGAMAVTAVAMHDLDRDGRDEALLATRSVEGDAWCVALMQVAQRRDGGQAARWNWSERSLDGIVAIAAGDIDADGRRDIVALRRDGGLLLFAGTRAGPVLDQALPAPAAYRGCAGYDLKLVDLDGDARLEAIASFAGDDGGPEGSDCPSGGGFQAWRLGGG